MHAALVPELDAQKQAESGLPLAWYDVLLELVEEPFGRLRMTGLAARVTLRRSEALPPRQIVGQVAERGVITPWRAT